MAILIDIKFPEWLKDEDLLSELSPLMAGVDIRTGDNPGNPEDIELLIVSNYQKNEADKYPNLKLIQKTGAGIENILADVAISPSVRIARSNAQACGKEMAAYALAFVLQEQRHMRIYTAQQKRLVWAAYPPIRAEQTTVATLGLGRMGRFVATGFASTYFNALGWSQTKKDLAGVSCYENSNGLQQVLEVSDFVVSVLPSTDETRGMFNSDLFRQFKQGAIFINIGRGDQVNEGDLIEALNSEHLSGAVLDVCANEPLPANDPLWTHPKVQITPHVSGWHSYVPADIVENYHRMKAGKPCLNEVDRAHGY